MKTIRSLNDLPSEQIISIVVYGHRNNCYCKDVEFMVDVEQGKLSTQEITFLIKGEVMEKLYRPAGIVFYLLMFLVFFFVGVYTAGIVGAGKNQMLASGAIVVGWGVLFAVIAFVASFFIAHFLSHKLVRRLNWILLVLLIIAYGFTHLRYMEREKKKEIDSKKIELPQRPTTMPKGMSARYLISASSTANDDTSSKASSQVPEPDMGIGFFTPNYYEHPTLYIYGGVNLEKSLSDHMPTDSVVFAYDEHQNPTATYAPPWLHPEHLKLDYGIITFKVMGLGFDFIKVETNRKTKQISYLDKYKGKFQSWQEFILSVNSVEFIDKDDRKVRIKPLDYAGEVFAKFAFMKPLLVQNEWMYVKLVNDSLTEQGKGWIRWKKGNKLLVSYSLLY